MIEDYNLETYLAISTNKYGIYLIEKNNYEILYQNEEKVNEDVINFKSLQQFLDKNIFKIEKFTGKFVKNIFTVIENEKILNIHIGIKKKIIMMLLTRNILSKHLLKQKTYLKKIIKIKI